MTKRLLPKDNIPWNTMVKDYVELHEVNYREVEYSMDFDSYHIGIKYSLN